MSEKANIYPFSLEFKKNYNGKPFFASFPFMADGIPITEISCGISSIFAGDMKYEKENQNRRVLFAALGLASVNVYGLEQIHSRFVLEISDKNPPLAEADGMVTQDKDIVLSVTTADCLPVYLYDTKSGAFGIVHSGWKGTGIVINAVNLMKKTWGTNPCGIAAVIGPCIDSCCYKVDETRAEAFKKDIGEEGVKKTDGSFYLDLKKANVSLLKDACINNIAVCRECTFCDKRLGSFRREGSQFTHMAALVNC
jgi:YfiH family protein